MSTVLFAGFEPQILNPKQGSKGLARHLLTDHVVSDLTNILMISKSEHVFMKSQHGFSVFRNPKPIQGYLAHKRQSPPPLAPPLVPRYSPTAGS